MYYFGQLWIFIYILVRLWKKSQWSNIDVHQLSMVLSSTTSKSNAPFSGYTLFKPFSFVFPASQNKKAILNLKSLHWELIICGAIITQVVGV